MIHVTILILLLFFQCLLRISKSQSVVGKKKKAVFHCFEKQTKTEKDKQKLRQSEHKSLQNTKNTTLKKKKKTQNSSSNNSEV